MKIAVIHDWLDKYGGAERVINSLDKIIKFDYFFAYADVMNDVDKRRMFNGRYPDIISSNILRYLGGAFRFALPLFPLVTRLFNKQSKNKKFDLIISSSWCLSKGFRSGTEKHVCYLQARNFKYIWDEYDNYFKGILGIIFLPFRKYLQNFDKKMSENPDFLISNSKFVQDWVEKHYKKQSVVIYPPVSLDNFILRDSDIRFSEYYVTVGRLVPYKRFDLLVKAFINLNKKLIIIGDGTESAALKKISAGCDNIIFKGYLQAEEINHYISNAKAFVFSSLEDFGIAPVEAQACGTPVIAYGKGGVLETVIEGKTGMFFYSQSIKDIEDTVVKFESNIQNFDPVIIRQNAKRFSREVFENNMTSFLFQNNLIEENNIRINN